MTDTTPYSSCVSAIETMWSGAWDSETPYIWQHNSDDPVPSIYSTQYWLHLAVEFEDERAVAFGQGSFNVERELRGVVVVRVFGARGVGETTILSLLDQALVVFRSQKTTGLSFIGTMPLLQPGASEDGSFWIRSAIAPFVYRFRG